jgi:hypothetical protein
MFAAAYAPKERVFLEGRLCDLVDVVVHMDQALYYEACEWAGTGASEQAVVDLYLRLHEKRHGVPFRLPPR